MHLTIFAYLDPGTGSLLVQSVIGAVVGVGIFGRRIISNAGRRAKNLITRSREEATEE
jgi:hypothetical protein